MPKVLVDCYINDNFGDDLFLRILCNKYPNIQFYAIARKQNKKMFRSIQNLKYLSFDKPLIEFLGLTQQYKQKLRKKTNEQVDAHITIGGSLFMERKDIDNDAEYNKFVSKIIKGKSNYLIGCNFGGYSSKKFYDDYHRAFTMYDNVCFRDKYSFDLFQESLTNISLAPDVAFQLDYPVDKIIDKKYVLISVIDLESRSSLKKYERNYIEIIISQIRKFINQNYRIVLFSACHSENDTLAIEKIKSKLSPKELGMMETIIHTNLDESIKLIAESSVVISTRLHVTILSLLFNKRTLPLIYSDKIINVFKDIEYSNQYIDIRNIKNNQYVDPKKFKISKEIRESSKNQFAAFDSFLK